MAEGPLSAFLDLCACRRGAAGEAPHLPATRP